MDIPIYIYNSLTKKKDKFIPRASGKVNIYSCGVTVYDDCHIGHARSLYIFDVIRRYLKYRGLDVRFVRNITDIDDKIINRAKELKCSWGDLVRRYIDSYYEDIKELNIEKADYEPRATKNIPEMISHIAGLINKGYAYVTDTGVYFSVRKFKDYGKLSGQSIEDMLTGVRKEADETKNDPLDFALWKKSKPDEPFWDSPWGKGRPGWHIECSVMSAKYLKTGTLDIHAGGRDLIFPHHENEIAQSEALTGKPFANYWIHHGLLTINGQKMAKSLGNFVTIKDFLKRACPVDALKLFFLQAHYSQPIDFTWERIEEKRSALYRITLFLKTVQMREEEQDLSAKTDLKKNIAPGELRDRVQDARAEFEKAMEDDFNTASAVAALFEIVNICNNILLDVKYTKEYLPALAYAKKSIQELGNILGLSFSEVPLAIPEETIKMHADTRQKLKEEKNYEQADKIRKELEEKGIILEDTKDGKTTWRRKI